MKFFFVGIAMRSYSHDYSELHAVLSSVDARRVSKRIWLISVERDEVSLFDKLRHSLSTADQLLIVEQGGKRAAARPSGRAQAEQRLNSGSVAT